MILRNKKGMGLIGVMIGVAISIVAIIGVTKAIMQFSGEAKKITSSRTVSNVKSNVISMLRSKKAWSWATAARQGSCLPGNKKCPMIFWYNPSNPSNRSDYNKSPGVKIWACNLSSGGAIAYFNQNGAPLSLGTKSSVCRKCSKSKDMKNCHLKRLKENSKKYVRVKILPLKNYNASVTNTPPFKFKVEDYSLSKTSKSFSVQDGQTVFSPSTSNCPTGQFMVGYSSDDGTPQCARPQLKPGACMAGSVVIRIDPDGTPICAIAPVANIADNVKLKGGVCPPGQVARQLGSDGTLVCVIAVRINVQCPAGTFVHAIDALGQIVCRVP